MKLAIFLVCIEVALCVNPHPWDSVSKADAGWQNLHKKFVQTTLKQGKQIHLVFYGDSITHGWAGTEGKNVWKEYYGNLSAVNYGISGDRTEHLVYRISNGEVEGLNPKVVVLKIGTNNMGRNTVEDIAHGVKAIIDLLHKKLPKTNVLLLAILSRNSLNDKVKQVNHLLAKYENGKSVRYLNMNSHFENSNGTIHSELFKDGVHLTEKGYKVWAQTMDPLLKQMLK